MSTPALFTKHRGIAFRVADSYFLPGSDKQDVQQEALIGIWIACRKHDPSKGPFPPFARMVIERRLQSCVMAANREKHRVLTDSVREASFTEEDDEVGLWGTVASPSRAEEWAEFRDTLRWVVKMLTPLELEAVRRSMMGFGCTEKPFCNALRRARIESLRDECDELNKQLDWHIDKVRSLLNVEADRDRLAEAAHDLNEYASNKAGYWQHPLTEKARAHFAVRAGREGSDDA